MCRLQFSLFWLSFDLSIIHRKTISCSFIFFFFFSFCWIKIRKKPFRSSNNSQKKKKLIIKFCWWSFGYIHQSSSTQFHFMATIHHYMWFFCRKYFFFISFRDFFFYFIFLLKQKKKNTVYSIPFQCLHALRIFLCLIIIRRLIRWQASLYTTDDGRKRGNQTKKKMISSKEKNAKRFIQSYCCLFANNNKIK